MPKKDNEAPEQDEVTAGKTKKGGKEKKQGGGMLAVVAGALLALLFLGAIAVAAGIYFNFFKLRTTTITYLESMEPSGIVRQHISEERKKELDEKQAQIDQKDAEIAALTKQLADKDVVLEAKNKENDLLKEDLQRITNEKQVQEAEQKNMIKILDGMDASDAAKVLDSYKDRTLAVSLLKQMNAKRSSEILSTMEAERAALFMEEMH